MEDFGIQKSTQRNNKQFIKNIKNTSLLLIDQASITIDTSVEKEVCADIPQFKPSQRMNSDCIIPFTSYHRRKSLYAWYGIFQNIIQHKRRRQNNEKISRSNRRHE